VEDVVLGRYKIFVFVFKIDDGSENVGVIEEDVRPQLEITSEQNSQGGKVTESKDIAPQEVTD